MRFYCPALIAGFVAICFAPASGALAQEKLQIDGYCQYSGEDLPEDIYGFESDSQAQDAVKRVLDHTGLVQNFAIRAANVENAAAVIQGEERLILYNQDFMLLVVDKTKTDWSAVSIMAHEVGHHLQGHTIQAGGSRPSIELEADKYSGYVLYRMGATLPQARAAMEALGSDVGSPTHPAKSARLAAITNGWLAAKALDENPPDVDTPSATPQPQGPIATTPVAAPGPAIPNYIARIVFPADPVGYFVTATNDIVGVVPGGTPVIIGKRMPPSLPGFAWMYSTAVITYGVTPDGKVLSKDSFGNPFQVGYVTSP